MLVEGHEQRRVQIARPLGRRRRADGVVEAGEEVLSADQRRRRVPAQSGGQHAERGVHVVVGVADDLGLDERVGGQLTALDVLEELVGGEEVRREPPPQPGSVDEPGQGVVRRRVAVDLPRQAVRFEPLEDRLGRVVLHERLRRRQVHDVARRRGGVEERPVRERARRHLAEPVVERREPPSEARHDRHLLGRVARHDRRVLVVGGLAAEFRREGADVVGDEAVHCGLAVRVVGRVERLLRVQHRPVGVVEDPEQLGVDVGELLSRIRPRRVHRGRHPVRHHLALRAVLSPRRDRVAQLLADHALERGHLARLVQATEQVVEGTVLEHHHNHMIKRVVPALTHHLDPPTRRRWSTLRAPAPLMGASLGDCLTRRLHPASPDQDDWRPTRGGPMARVG